MAGTSGHNVDMASGQFTLMRSGGASSYRRGGFQPVVSSPSHQQIYSLKQFNETQRRQMKHRALIGGSQSNVDNYSQTNKFSGNLTSNLTRRNTLLGSVDYTKEQPPKMGPFAQRPAPSLLSSSRRPMHFQGQTRHERLQVPYYDKPVKVQ